MVKQDATKAGEDYRDLLKKLGLDDIQVGLLQIYLEREIYGPVQELIKRQLSFLRENPSIEQKRLLLDEFQEVQAYIVETAREMGEQSRKAARRALTRTAAAVKKSMLNSTTRLPNKEAFHQDLCDQLRDRRIHTWALVYLDCRDFADWNNTYEGHHEVGDTVINLLARTIGASVLLHGGTLGHPHGDEFSMLFPLPIPEAEGAVSITGELLENIRGAVDGRNWSRDIHLALEHRGLAGIVPADTVFPNVFVDMGCIVWNRPEGVLLSRDNVSSLATQFKVAADSAMYITKHVKAVVLQRGARLQRSSYIVFGAHWDGGTFVRSSKEVKTNLPDVESE